jgi:HAD superfamily phosphatase
VSEKILVFDMDGVLVDVSDSYRQAIVETVNSFAGTRITKEKIQEYKNQGGWNNDWALSQKICADLGVEVEYQAIIDRFNELFLGMNGDGLISRERWISRDGALERLARTYRFALFTGRMRYEADITLNRFCGALPFDPIICADDVVNGKPAPDGLFEIARRVPDAEMWYVGDTVDDARASSAAKVPFIGIAAANHGHRDELVRLFKEENAIAILDDINQLETVL